MEIPIYTAVEEVDDEWWKSDRSSNLELNLLLGDLDEATYTLARECTLLEIRYVVTMQQLWKDATLVRIVLDKGVDINHVYGELGYPIFFYAILCAPTPEHVQFIIDSGANLELRCGDGESVFSFLFGMFYWSSWRTPTTVQNIVAVWKNGVTIADAMVDKHILLNYAAAVGGPVERLAEKIYNLESLLHFFNPAAEFTLPLEFYVLLSRVL